jgi:predicted dehydrogenase
MRVSLLGTSHWHAAMHLDAMRFAGADIVAVWDADPHRAAAFAETAAAPTAGFEAAIAAADLVVLMGHPASLPAQARAVIEAHKPLILEKPAVTGTAELEHLCAQAAAAGAVVGVPLPNRFGPAVQELHRLRATGRSGPVVHAAFRLINGPPQRYRDDGVPWLLDPAIGGGGALRNLGIHGIDAALALAQGELRVLASHIGKRIHTGERVEDHALVTLADEDGALFVVEAGYTFASMAPGGDFEWRLVTDRAVLLDQGDRASAIVLGEPRRPLVPEPTSTRYRLFAVDTLARLAAGRPPAITLKDYLASMRLIDAAYAKASS